jgi:outer membrane protein OmpU
MKKVLLATSALFLTAGVASAELTFSGTATAGIFKAGEKAAVAKAKVGIATLAADALTKSGLTSLDGSAYDALKDAAVAEAKAQAGSAKVAAAKDFTVYSGIDIEIAASTTTDNGMTISASTDMGAGFIPDIADKELDEQTDDLTAPKVTIGYNGVTVVLKSEGVDDYYDGDLEDYDIGVSGAFGGLSYGIALETESKTASDYSAMIGYTMAGVSLTIKQNDVDGAEDQRSVSASYTMGAVKATLTNDNKGAAKDVNTFAVQYTAGPAVITASMKDDKNNNTNKDGNQSWDLGVVYTTGAYTISASTDESSAWEADVAYDLGGGATMFVAADDKQTTMAGVSFAF